MAAPTQARRVFFLTHPTKISSVPGSLPIVGSPSTATPVNEEPGRNHAHAAMRGERSVENSHVYD